MQNRSQQDANPRPHLLSPIKPVPDGQARIIEQQRAPIPKANRHQSNPASLTIPVGQQASTTVTFAPLSNSSSTVALACSVFNIMGAACAVSPASLNLANNAPANATLNVTTLPVSSSPNGVKVKSGVIAGRWIPGGVSGIATLLLLILPGRRRRYRFAITLGACSVILTGLGCGGGASSSSVGGGGAAGGGGTAVPVSTSITVSASSTKVPQGTPVTVKATVTSTNRLTGTINFWELNNGGAFTPPLAITNGTATAQLNLSLGIHQVYATSTTLSTARR